MFKFINILTIIFLFVAYPAFGATKYLDLGAASNGDGSISSPYNTLANAQSGITTGDTINIKGTATISGVFYWDSGKNATLQLWSGETCTLTLDATGQINIQGGALNISGISLTTSGTRTDYVALIDADVQNVVISGLTISNYGGTAIYVGASGIEVSGCSISDATAQGHAIHINAANAIVYGNTVSDLYGQSNAVFVQEGGDSADIHDNDFSSNALKSDIIARGSVNSDLTGVRIYRNYLHGANYVANIDIEASEGAYSVKDLLVYNNIINGKHSSTKVGWSGLIRIHAPGGESETVNRIYNNTLIMSGDDDSGELHKAALNIICDVAGQYTGHLEIKNNILYVADSSSNSYAYAAYIAGTPDVANVTSDNNLLYSTEGSGQLRNTESYVYGNNSKTNIDPLFVSTSIFKLQNNSQAIGTGADLSAYFTTDYIGISRGSLWDIGAYEYLGNHTLGSGPHYSIGTGATVTIQ